MSPVQKIPHWLWANILIFVLFITSFSVAAQDVIRIIENGREVIPSQELQAKFYSSETEEESAILDWYINQGYFNAEIDKITEVLYEVNTRCLFTLKNIEIIEPEYSRYSKNIESAYSPQRLEREVFSILDDLNSQGYIFAEAAIDSFLLSPENCTLTAKLTIDEGKKWYTGGIIFSGAKTNKQEFLRKVSGFRDSVLVTPALTERLKSNLVQSELFQEVADPGVFIQSGRIIILIPVEERRLNTFDGLLGYVPDQNGEGQIVGDFELSLWNVINQGNGIDLQYQRLRPETSRLNIGVSQDWFGAIPLGAGVNFRFYQNDTTYQTRDLSLDSYYIVSGKTRITGAIGRLSSTQGSNALNIVEPDGNKTYGELGFRYSSLNNPEIPTKGIRFHLSFGAANKSVDIDSTASFSQQYISSSASVFLPVTSKNILAFSGHGFYLTGEKYTESDLARFGGANSLRGYSEEQFTASRMLWSDLEYRFMLDRSSYLFAFGAAGTYHRPRLLTESDDTFKTTDFLYSTGIGLSYRIRIGRIKFTYAVSPEESLGNGKVHLGIVTKL